MSRFGKIENGALKYAPYCLRTGSASVLNPSEEILLANGYKPVNFNYQEEAPEGYHWETRGWEETENECRQVWELVEDPVPSDDDEIDAWDAAGIILGGDFQ